MPDSDTTQRGKQNMMEARLSKAERLAKLMKKLGNMLIVTGIVFILISISFLCVTKIGAAQGSELVRMAILVSLFFGILFIALGVGHHLGGRWSVNFIDAHRQTRGFKKILEKFRAMLVLVGFLFFVIGVYKYSREEWFGILDMAIGIFLIGVGYGLKKFML